MNFLHQKHKNAIFARQHKNFWLFPNMHPQHNSRPLSKAKGGMEQRYKNYRNAPPGNKVSPPKNREVLALSRGKRAEMRDFNGKFSLFSPQYSPF